jgi:mannose-1-phosphate guanylyltransferase/mannose-6-phosphate isomerase
MAMRIAGILCGGNGTRLWPLSREKFPKQFHDLAGTGQPLLIDTLERLEALSLPITIITNAQHQDSTRTMLSRFHKQAQVIGEPVARDTAAAVGLLTLFAMRQNPDAIVGSFHSDHVIKDQAAFQTAVEAAYKLAEEQGSVVTIAINPTYPATAFGYLQVIDDASVAPHKRVTKFIEKPNRESAEQLLAQGNVAWNAGMFFFPAKVMAEHFTTHLPELWQKLSLVADDLSNLSEIFTDLPKIAIDVGIMEKIEQILSVTYGGDWVDIGSWEDVMTHRAQAGDVTQVAGTNNQVLSLIPHAKKVVFVGLDDVIAVDTPDALLLLKKGSGQALKQAVEQLKESDPLLVKEHSFEERPWGRFEILLNTDKFKSKRLLLLPGGSLSYQRHQHRSEEWTITSGEGTVTLNDVAKLVRAGEHVTIPAGTKHRLYNHTSEPLELIEVQTGTYFGEDDIERFSDNYGRV